MSENCYEFELMPLPYADDALEPYINTQTMQVHHDRLLKAYVDRLNETLAACPNLRRLSLEQLLKNPCALPAPVRTQVVRFGGGVYNHNFFFRSLRPGTEGNMPTGALGRAIDRQFGSFARFQGEFKERAMSVFGSGWMWLVRDRRGCLRLEATANQDSPISLGYTPLTVIDVWEHAYFLQYLNLRGDYIDRWFCVVNWERAETIYRNT